MASFPNSMDIDIIRMRGIKVQCFCPIGKTWCTYEIGVEMMPGNTICDYLEVQKYFSEMPKDVTLESCAAQVRNYLRDTYDPLKVTVTVSCDDASHFPVDVVATYFKEVIDYEKD